MANCGCNDYSRSQLLRAARRPRPARACRRSSRGCRCRRAPGSRGARSSRARPGWRCRLRRGKPRPDGLRGRDRAGRAAPRRHDPRLGLLRRRHRRAQRAAPRSATRATRSCGPTLGAAPAATARRSPRTRRCAGTRRAAALADAARRGQGHASCRRSATTTPTSRTSPRATTTRSASSTVGAGTGWLGRYLDLVGDADNPLQGLSMDGEPLADAGHRRRAGGGDRQRRRLRLLAPGSATRSQDEMFDALRPLGVAAGRLAGARPGARRRGQTGRLRDQLAPYQGGFDDASPVTYPTRRLRPQARRPRRLHRRRAADAGGDDRRRRRLRHPRRPGRQPASDLRETCEALLAFQRDLEARGLADRVLVADVERVRAPAGGERLAAPTTAPPAARFVIGSKAKGEMVGEFPGLATLDEDDNLRVTQRLPRRVLLAAGAVAGRGRRRRSSPTPPGSPARRWWPDAPGRARADRAARVHRLAGHRGPAQARERARSTASWRGPQETGWWT